MVLAHANVVGRIVNSTSLAYDDVTGLYDLTA